MFFDDIFEDDYEKKDINALCLKLEKPKRISFNLIEETNQLKNLINLPKEDEVYKLISIQGGFSSIAFINYVSKKETIEKLFVSSLTIGKKHINILNEIYENGWIKDAMFITSDIFKKTNASKYEYYEDFTSICNKNNWKYKTVRNHSKLILMKTKDNYYVLETSSNLNENPKIEQFNFYNNKEAFNFYYSFFEKVVEGGDNNDWQRKSNSDE